jgi:hypothetical protein
VQEVTPSGTTAGSFAGDAIAAVAFAVLAYRAGGPGGVALLVAVEMLPAASLMPLVSRAADKMPRERLLSAIDGIRLVLAFAVFALRACGIRGSRRAPARRGTVNQN